MTGEHILLIISLCRTKKTANHNDALMSGSNRTEDTSWIASSSQLLSNMHLVSSKDIVLFCHWVDNSLLTQLAPSLFSTSASWCSLSALALFCHLLHAVACCFVLLLCFLLLRSLASFSFFILLAALFSCFVLLLCSIICFLLSGVACSWGNHSEVCVIHRSPSRVTCTMQQELDSLLLLVWKRLRTINYYLNRPMIRTTDSKKLFKTTIMKALSYKRRSCALTVNMTT